MPQIVSSDADRVVGRINTDDDVVLEDVWYAEESVCLTVVPPEEGACSFGGLCMNAVAIDRRERTRSNGYVEPYKQMRCSFHNRVDKNWELTDRSHSG
jgi:hypothetical protein